MLSGYIRLNMNSILVSVYTNRQYTYLSNHNSPFPCPPTRTESRKQNSRERERGSPSAPEKPSRAHRISQKEDERRASERRSALMGKVTCVHARAGVERRQRALNHPLSLSRSQFVRPRARREHKPQQTCSNGIQYRALILLIIREALMLPEPARAGNIIGSGPVVAWAVAPGRYSISRFENMRLYYTRADLFRVFFFCLGYLEAGL